MPIKAGQFEYPERGWSQGRMRKRGERPEEPDDEAQIEQVKMFGRGKELQYGSPEFEKLAGSWARGRGGSSGVSPEAIAEQKSAIQAMAQQWTVNVDWNRVRREVPKGWSLLWTPLEMTGTPASSIRGANIQMFKGQVEKGVESYKRKRAEVLEEREEKRRTVGMRDPLGQTHEFELGSDDE